ncbi:MAG TPA: hypothetical protein VEB22_05610 [Phycisphaerales bacterium]|nr:hypothetical protein [Phycisphaerales bacterium]
MDRAKAKSMTRRVQAAAVVFVLLAVAAATAPLGATRAESPEAAPPPAPLAPKPAEAAKVEIDTPMLATALNAVSGPVKNQAAPVEDVAPTPTERPSTGIGSWRYLGAIMSSTYKRGIIVVNDKQHLLAVGQRFNPDSAPGAPANPNTDVEIVDIDRTFIKVRQGEVETQIDLAPRKRAELTVVDPASPAGRAAAANNPAAVRNGASGATMSGDAARDRRIRDLERFKADAKARGDDKAAMAYDSAITEAASGKEGRSEKGEKGVK